MIDYYNPKDIENRKNIKRSNVDLDYADYRRENSSWDSASIQRYMEQYKGKGKNTINLPINGETLLNIANEMNFPIELLLIQARVESNFGTKGAARHTNNIFNIGNITAGDNSSAKVGLKNGNRRMMPSWEDGIVNYIKVMKKEYLPRVEGNWRELFNKDNFKRHNGDRYASSKTYEDTGRKILSNFDYWRETPNYAEGKLQNANRIDLQKDVISASKIVKDNTNIVNRFINVKQRAADVQAMNVDTVLSTIDFSKSTFSIIDFDKLEKDTSEFLFSKGEKLPEGDIGEVIKEAYNKTDENKLNSFPSEVNDISRSVEEKNTNYENNFGFGGYLQPNGRTTTFNREEDAVAQQNTLANGGSIDGVPFVTPIGPEIPPTGKKVYDKTLPDLSFLHEGSVNYKKFTQVKDGTIINKVLPKKIIDNYIKLKSNHLEKGSKGTDVSTIQTFLYENGFYNKTSTKSEIDGIFGARTKKALQQYQKSKGLVSDGILGKKTLSSINGYSDSISPKGLKELPTKVVDKGVTRYFKDGKLQPIGKTLQREIFNKVVPTSARMLINDVSNNIVNGRSKATYDTITEEHIPKTQMGILRKVVKHQLSKGKYSIPSYDTWREVGMSGASIEDSTNLNNPINTIAQTIGRASIKVDKLGNIFIEDRYNFNDVGTPLRRSMNPFEVGTGKAIYDIARNIGQTFGSDNNNGAEVSIFIGNIKDL